MKMNAHDARVLARAAVLLVRAVAWALLDLDPGTDDALRGWMSCALDLLLLGADACRMRPGWLRLRARERREGHDEDEEAAAERRR